MIRILKFKKLFIAKARRKDTSVYMLLHHQRQTWSELSVDTLYNSVTFAMRTRMLWSQCNAPDRFYGFYRLKTLHMLPSNIGRTSKQVMPKVEKLHISCMCVSCATFRCLQNEKRKRNEREERKRCRTRYNKERIAIRLTCRNRSCPCHWHPYSLHIDGHLTGRLRISRSAKTSLNI